MKTFLSSPFEWLSLALFLSLSLSFFLSLSLCSRIHAAMPTKKEVAAAAAAVRVATLESPACQP
jgi:hypothetical protein